MKNLQKLLDASKIFTPEDRRLHNYLKRIDSSMKEKIDLDSSTLDSINSNDLQDWITGIKTIDENFQKYSRKQLTGILEQKLESNSNKQKDIWNDFVQKNANEEYIQKCLKCIWETPIDHRFNTIWYHIILTLKLIYEKENISVPEELTRAGVFGLLNCVNEKTRVYIHYLSDTIRDTDTTNSRIVERYRILGKIFGIDINIDFLGSTPGRSYHTGAQVMQIIGQSAEIYLDKHKMNTALNLSIMVNNADRSKHKKKEKAAGSNCLWARVLDPKTKVLHDVIGVDNEVFSVFSDYIEELYIIHGMPGNEAFEDISQGTQFRSLHNFPYVQILNGISEGGAPPGFKISKVDKNEYLNHIKLEPNELILIDKDHYLNGKCLSTHQDGVLGLVKHLGVNLDEESLIGRCYHPDTNEVIKTLTLIPTEYLGRHPGKCCIWNGSSRGFEGKIIPEIGKSKDHAEDIAKFIRKFPIGTKIVLTTI